MTASAAPVDLIFKALADPTRRNVIESLSAGSATFTELASQSHMAQPSFLQHLRILESANLILSTKTGRVRTYHIQANQLVVAENWLKSQKAIWETRLDQFDKYALNLKEQSEKHK